MFQKSKELTSRHEEIWGDVSPIQELNSGNCVGRNCAGLKEVMDSLELDRGTEACVLEIGAEFGGSTRFFLDYFPFGNVVSIDPWVDNYPIPPFWAHLQPFADKSNGSLFDIYRSFCWEVKDRLLPVRAWSQDGMLEVYDLGISPDIVFVDGDHRYHGVFADLVLARFLFPKAIIVGDDWNFDSAASKYLGISLPVRKAAIDFCRQFDFTYDQVQNTFMLRPVSS